PSDLRLRHLVDDWRLVEFMDSYCLHLFLPISEQVAGALGRPAVRVADPEHARADGRIGVDAGPRDTGLAEVDRNRCLVDPCPGLRIDEQRGVVARGQAELGAALPQAQQVR